MFYYLNIKRLTLLIIRKSHYESEGRININHLTLKLYIL